MRLWNVVNALEPVGVAALAESVARTRRPLRRNPYFDGPESDHFNGHIFFNPDGKPPGRFIDLLKWQLGGGRAKWPSSWPSPFPPAKPEPRISGTGLRVTMVGHATTLVQVAGLNILTDPVWSERVSPLAFAGPKRVNRPGIDFEALPPVDLVLLTHNHYDHLDLATLARLKKSHDPLVVTPLGNDAIVRAAIPDMRISTYDWGGRVELAGGVVVYVEPAHHWSARGTRDHRMALWGGFVIEAAPGKVYFAGDTGFHAGRNYRLMAKKHRRLRLAILPIGAYEPRWFMEGHHQNPDEAVRGMLLCQAESAIGCHWGTFQLTNEPIDEPRQKLVEALDVHGVPRERFRPMLPGEVWDVPAAP
jgi:L-ascorbate metabolism protein UlaG (beta-lactamase superfamily)